MKDNGTVSTQDTPDVKNSISVITDETELHQAASDGEKPDAPKPDASAAPKKDEPEGDKPKGRDRKAERRIQKLTRELAAARSDNDATKQEVQDLRDQISSLKEQSAPKPAKPKLDDYENPEEWADALTEWKAQSTDKPTPKTEPKAKPAPKGGEPDLDEEDFKGFQDAGLKRFGDDFVDALRDTSLPVTPVMSEFIVDSDLGPEILMYLYDHRREANKLARTENHVDLTAKLKDLESKVDGYAEESDGTITLDDEPKPKEKPKPKAKKATKAPEPPGETVGGDSNGGEDDIENMSMADYHAHRQKQEANKRPL